MYHNITFLDKVQQRRSKSIQKCFCVDKTSTIAAETLTCHTLRYPNIRDLAKPLAGRWWTCIYTQQGSDSSFALLSLVDNFYLPRSKGDNVLGSVRPPVCPSIHPSVRGCLSIRLPVTTLKACQKCLNFLFLMVYLTWLKAQSCIIYSIERKIYYGYFGQNSSE